MPRECFSFLAQVVLNQSCLVPAQRLLVPVALGRFVCGVCNEGPARHDSASDELLAVGPAPRGVPPVKEWYTNLLGWPVRMPWRYFALV